MLRESYGTNTCILWGLNEGIFVLKQTVYGINTILKGQ
jgi:hypothetical protein